MITDIGFCISCSGAQIVIRCGFARCNVSEVTMEDVEKTGLTQAWLDSSHNETQQSMISVDILFYAITVITIHDFIGLFT